LRKNRRIIHPRKMKKLVIIAFIALTAPARAQVATPKHSIVYFTGEKVEGDRLIYESPILKTPYFDLDGLQIETPSIAYFQNNHGYFANLAKIHGDKSERYAIRIKTGNINLYEEIEMEVYGGDNIEIAEEGNENLAKGEDFQYFNVGTGEIKKANYNNLKANMADNAKALREVNMIRNYSLVQGLLIGIGAGIIGFEIHRQTDQAVRFTPAMAMGIVVGGSSYFLINAKGNARWLAVDAYNKPTVVNP